MRTLAVAFLAGAAFLLDEALEFVFAVPFLSAVAFVVAAAFLLEEDVVPVTEVAESVGIVDPACSSCDVNLGIPAVPALCEEFGVGIFRLLEGIGHVRSALSRRGV